MAHVVNTRTQLYRRATMQVVWLALLCAMFLALTANLGRSVLGNPKALQYVRHVGPLRAVSEVIVQPIVDVVNHRHKPAIIRRWLFVAAHLIALFIILQLVGAPLVVIHGYQSEKRVLRELRRLPDEYWVLNDLRVPGSRPAQLDHVLVSPAGLWCLETRAHRGYVRGGEYDYEWVQAKDAKANKRGDHKFPNPARQNAAHCSCLKDYLMMQGLDIPVKSMVVFTSADLEEMLTITPIEKVEMLVPAILRTDVERTMSDVEVQRVVESLTGLLAIGVRTPGSLVPPGQYQADASGTRPPDLSAVDPRNRSVQA